MNCARLRTETRWGRAALLAAALFALASVFALPAFGAGDPVKGGSFKLDPSRGFKHQLAAHAVSMSPKSFSVKGGQIDPTTGTGWLKLRGRLSFSHRGKRVAFGHLVARLGAGGVLRSGKTKLFRLRGGSVDRLGFGASVGGIDSTLLRSAAARLSRKLELTAPLHRVRAGSISLSEQPQTVQVNDGTATIDPDGSPGSFDSKLAAHCIDPAGGISVIAPGSQPGGPGTRMSFPVSFGTISPLGTDGVINQSGGIQLANGGSGLVPGCSASNTVTIQISDLSADLLNRSVIAHLSISGSGSPVGNLAAAISFPLDVSGTLVNADPADLSLAINGSAIKLNPVAASTLNLIFPQPSPVDPAMQFQDGDAMGTVGLSVQVR